MKIIITESQYELLNEQLVKYIGNGINKILKSTPKVIKPIKKGFNNLDIPFKEFDDINNSYWRKLGNKGDYDGATNHMVNYLKHNLTKLKDWEIGGVMWHIGQMKAFQGSYDEAIKFMSNKKVLDSIEPNYQLGTISYLKKDRKNLLKYYENIVKLFGKDDANSKILKNLIDNFDKPYKDIY